MDFIRLEWRRLSKNIPNMEPASEDKCSSSKNVASCLEFNISDIICCSKTSEVRPCLSFSKTNCGYGQVNVKSSCQSSTGKYFISRGVYPYPGRYQVAKLGKAGGMIVSMPQITNEAGICESSGYKETGGVHA
jgi:hypothetical protein